MRCKIFKNSCARSALLLSLLMVATGARALTCDFITGAAVTVQMPIQGTNITVGPDVPNGTVIHQQYYRPAAGMSFGCSNANGITYRPIVDYHFTRTPMPPSSYSSGPFAGKIMQTSIPGIGVAFRRGTNPTDVTVPFTQTPWREMTGGGSFTAPGSFDLDMFLIKTGDIQPGTLNGADLPTVGAFFSVPGVLDLKAVETSFTGSLNIVSRTCTTPNVTVDMGSYGVEQFKNAGDATLWRSAVIQLTDCPRFYGKLIDGRNSYYSDNGNTAIGVKTPNTLYVTVQPNTPVIDAANGIFSLQSGADSASGVGIQLTWGGDNVDFSSGRSFTLGDSSSTSRVIPLLARYIKTSGPVKPGKANATATFTINYY